jgi:acetyl-CoA synthetase
VDEPRWLPDPDVVAAANLTDAMHSLGFESYDSFYAWSAAQRAEFWGLTVERLGIVMSQRPAAVLEGSPQHPRWLPGARLNIAESCLTAAPDADAVVFSRGGELHRMSYGELQGQVNRFANGLRELGVAPGQRVAITMAMSVESVIAYLGTVLAGAVVVSIADSFAPAEIATRLAIAGADIVVTQDVIRRRGKTLPMYEKVVAAGAGRAIVVIAGDGTTLRRDDHQWQSFLADDERFVPVQRDPGDHMNILFSSGTTGDPKAIPWTHTSPIKAAADGHYHQDIHPSDTVAWPTNLGWMMGPWLIYASLINRATVALYDDIPTGAGFAAFVERAGVTVLGVVPSLVAEWRSSGVAEPYDWSQIRLFSSTGETSNPGDMAYLMDLAGTKPIMEYIGGTELAGGYLSGTVLQPCVPSTFTTPTLGGAVHILDEEGEPTEAGEVFIEPPTMGLSTELLNRDHDQIYYAGTPTADGVQLRRHGDRIRRLPGGGYRAQGRVDDAMNLSGIKVSAAEIERAVAGTPGIVEAAAIAVEQRGGGPSSLVMYVVLDTGSDVTAATAEMQSRIGQRLNPLFKIATVVAVDELPRTASAKVMRRALRDDFLQR